MEFDAAIVQPRLLQGLREVSGDGGFNLGEHLLDHLLKD
jgi:hypothetical protein